MPNAFSVPVRGSFSGKKSRAKTRPLAVLYRKKSYHSMVVPMVLAMMARRSCRARSASSPPGSVAAVAFIVQCTSRARGPYASGISHDYALETWAIHAGVDRTDTTRALVPPIHPTAAFARPSLDDPGEFRYSRHANPTRAALEQVLCRLHGARHAAAFGSGMAAVGAVGQLLPAGSHVLLPDDVYGNTHRLYTLILPEQTGVEIDFVDYTDLEAVERAIRPERTRLLWVETPTN